MATVVPTSSVEHLALVKAQAPLYLKGVSDLTFRRRLWLAMLLKHGRVEYNATSHSTTWNVEFSQPEVRQYGDAGDLEFNEHDALQQLTVNVRGYTATDKLSEKQREMNGGEGMIDNLYKNKSKRLVKRVRQVLCKELYIDGGLAANANRFEGIETFMGTGTTVAGDKVAQPSDTYAGKSTALQNDGGNWSTDLDADDRPNADVATDWPLGSGDTDYDYISPLTMNTSSTAWEGGTKWRDNCEEVMRFARIVQHSRGAKDEDQSVPYIHMLSPDRYADFLQYYSSRQRQVVPHQASANLGFENTMNFEGDAVHYESDCAAGTGYGIVPSMMEMFVLGPNKQLLQSRGPEWAITKMAYLYLVFMFGNLRFQPKFFSAYKDVA